ncbi:MAG: hypothetical protein ABIS84_04615 [Arachnia sp.]
MPADPPRESPAVALTQLPVALTAALQCDDPLPLTATLEVLSRGLEGRGLSAADLAPVVAEHLEDLCRAAVADAVARVGAHRRNDRPSVAAILTPLVGSLELPTRSLMDAAEIIPIGAHASLSPLALAIDEQLVPQVRRIVAEDPQWGEILPIALHNLSTRLSEVARIAEALTPLEEAVDLIRSLAQVAPDAHDPALASALNALSVLTARAGRNADAKAIGFEAIAIQQRLANAHPEIHEADLAQSLHNMSNHCREAGQGRFPVMLMTKAVEIRRRLAEAHPGLHLPSLAGSLNNLSNMLALSQPGVDPLPAIEEAVGIRRQLAQDDPTSHAADLAQSLFNLSRLLVNAGRTPEGVVALEESIDLRRGLVTDGYAVDTAHLAHSLDILSALHRICP